MVVCAAIEDGLFFVQQYGGQSLKKKSLCDFSSPRYEQYAQLVGAAGKGDKGGEGGAGLLGMAASGTNAALGVGGAEGQDPHTDDEDETTSIFKITVPANTTINMTLTYSPTDLGQHYWELPFVGAGNVKTPGCKRVVHGEALRPRMLFSTTTFDFKSKVVATGLQSMASILELHMHNADDYPLNWKIDVEILKQYQGVFYLEPREGKLAPEEDCIVKCSFLPTEATTYNVQLPVYISPPRTEASPTDGFAHNNLVALPIDDRAYLFLRLKGVGSVPKLSFDMRIVQLPAVPLGVTAKASFNIVNEGYDSLEAKYRLPAEYGKIPLTIRFPEGQSISSSRSKVPVDVEFVSQKPLAFSAKLEFLDQDNQAYVIPVCGTADNSVLTAHQYMQENVADYTLEGEAVVQLKPAQKAIQHTQAEIETRSPLISSSQQASWLLKWLNCVGLRVPIDHFPQDLIAQNGKPFFETIEFWSGKNPLSAQLKTGPANAEEPKKANTKDQPKVLQKIMGQIASYEQVLNFAKQHGCLLSMVRPEYLLSQESYTRYVQMQVGKSSTHSNKKSLEKSFQYVSFTAWSHLVMQVAKVFLLGRVTPKSFRKELPGMLPPANEDGEKGKMTVELQACLDVRGMAGSNV